VHELKEDERAIEAEAAAWVVRLDAGPLDPTEQRAFEAWLETSERHAAAFAFARTTWAQLGDPHTARRHAGTLLPLAMRPRQRLPATPHPVSRRWVWRSLAASVVLTAGFGAYRAADPLVMLRADYRTAPGEMRRVTLPDGSSVQLNTDSAIAVHYGASRREVELLSGEAGFTVAKAADGDGRAFVVQAADGEVTALGTRFVVRRLDARVDVTVVEHRVEVSLRDAATGSRQTAVLKAAQAVGYSEGGRLGEIRRVDPERELAWLRGRLLFDRVPLAQVVAELNRYRRGRIVVINPALAERQVSGVFRLDDLPAAIDVIAAELGAHVVEAPFITTLY
jgi:transmembrane sensor